jgi:uncharacterized surface protein with fasciclin (FAS1) repeats
MPRLRRTSSKPREHRRAQHPCGRRSGRWPCRYTASPGPFTIFAPTDTAFAKLPDGTVATLVKPENKGTLTTILTYHAVAGKVTSGDLVKLINAGGGKATITTVSGGKLTARLSGDKIVITDAKGGTTAVTTADVMTSNGVIHVTDGVFLPA